MTRCLLAIGVLIVSLSGRASAQDTPEQQIAAVHELMMYANYRGALPQVQALLARTDLTAQQRNAGLEQLAIVDLALRDEAGAREALAQLYARDPGHRITDPDASPVVQSAFARAREGASAIAVTMEHTPPTLARRGAPEIVARLGEGADAVHEVRLSYRQAGERRFTQVVLGVEATEARGRIPVTSDDPGALTIEYYLEALAPSTTVLRAEGSADAPLTIEIPAEAEIPTGGPSEPTQPTGGGDIASEPWLWIVVGVVVVGAGVGIGVGVALSTPAPANGSLGSVDLPLLRF
jgi:hypothetical protein